MSSRAVLIVQDSQGGHYSLYTAVLCRAALAQGDSVSVALPAGSKSSADFQIHLSTLQNQVQFIEMREPASVRHIRTFCSEFDLVVIPNGDRFAMAMALVPLVQRRAQISLLIMSDPRLNRSLTFKRLMLRTAKMALLRLLEPRQGIHLAWLRGPGSSSSTRERIALDPVLVDEDEGSAESLALSDRYWFGVTGVIAPWKNLPLVLAAFERLDDSGAGLLIAGPFVESVRIEVEPQIDRLKQKGLEVTVIDRQLTNVEMNMVVREVDAVILAYSTHTPNSTLGKAGALGTRVIAAGSRSFVSHAQAADVGAFVSELSIDAVVESMNRALRSGPPVERLQIGSRQFTDTLLLRDGETTP